MTIRRGALEGQLRWEANQRFLLDMSAGEANPVPACKDDQPDRQSEQKTENVHSGHDLATVKPIG